MVPEEGVELRSAPYDQEFGASIATRLSLNAAQSEYEVVVSITPDTILLNSSGPIRTTAKGTGRAVALRVSRISLILWVFRQSIGTGNSSVRRFISAESH